MTLHSVANPALPNKEIDLLAPADAEKPGDGWSLMKLLRMWEGTVKAIEGIPAEYFELTERELVKKPTAVQRQLKISFWNEYGRAQRQRTEMILSNVVHGVCSKCHWTRTVILDQKLLAWIITPPTSDVLVWQELLELGYRRLRKVLTMPIVEKKYRWDRKANEMLVEKSVNVPLIKEMRAIVENMEDRLHGAIVQRQQIEAKTLSVNVNATQEAQPSLPKTADEEMAELKRMLARLEKVAGTLPELEAAPEREPEVIEVEVEPEPTPEELERQARRLEKQQAMEAKQAAVEEKQRALQAEIDEVFGKPSDSETFEMPE